MSLPSFERVSGLLCYDKNTGLFRRKPLVAGGVSNGLTVGSRHVSGYIRIGIGGTQYYAHRLAWLLSHGEWPCFGIDHINGVRDDNRIANLREATQSQNMQNIRARPIGGKYGKLLGATFDKRRGLWVAQIRALGRRRFIGYYSTEQDAHAAYLEEKSRLHPFQTIVTKSAD